MAATSFFSQEQLSSIANAVEETEALCGSEIVPVFAKQSSFYEVALWRGGFIIAALASIVGVIVYFSTDALIYMEPLFWILLPITIGVLFAVVVLFVPPLKRLLIGKYSMNKACWERAYYLFLKYGVSNTKKRTGIMVFVSLFEKQILILGDVGIAGVIPQESWEALVREYIDEIGSKGITVAIENTIKHCGNLIVESGLSEENNGDNELGNELRFDND